MRRLHMVWPWSVSSLMNFHWIGPVRNAKDLRALKQHLPSGGIVYVQRPPSDFAAIVSRGAQERTSEAGAMLNVSTNPSFIPNGALTSEINATGTRFIGRTAIPHASAPTVRFYALTRTDVSSPSSWLSAVPGLVYSSTAWLRGVIMHTSFMFTQGWLTASAFQHPVLTCPIVTVICASFLHYFNWTLFDSFWGALAMAGHGVVYALQLIQLVTGEPTTNAVVFILMVYLVALCGISSACGMAFLVWRGFLWIVSMTLNVSANKPTALLNSSSVIVSPTATFGVLERTRSQDPTNPFAPNSNKTSGRDSGSEHSELSPASDLPTPGPSAKPLSDLNPGMISQSHLVVLERFGGVAASLKPCQGKRVMPSYLLNVDWLMQNVIRMVSQ